MENNNMKLIYFILCSFLISCSLGTSSSTKETFDVKMEIMRSIRKASNNITLTLTVETITMTMNPKTYQILIMGTNEVIIL